MAKKINIILIVTGIGIICYFLNNFGLDNIWKNIKLSGFQLFNVLGIWAVVYLLNAYVLKIILGTDSKKVAFWELYIVTVSTYSINYITPFVSLGGEAYKIFCLKDKLGTRKAASSTILYTMLHMLAHAFFWLTGIFIAFIFFEFRFPEKLLMAIVLTGVLFLIWFFFSRHKKGVLKSFSEIIKKLKFLKSVNKKIDIHKERIDEIDEEIISLYLNRKKSFWRGLFVEFFARVLSSFEIYFIMVAIGINFTLWEAIYVTAAFTFLMNIIFFVPMELGTRESSLYFLIKGLSSVNGAGVFVAVVSRVRELFWIVLGIIIIQVKGTKYSVTGKNKKNPA